MRIIFGILALAFSIASAAANTTRPLTPEQIERLKALDRAQPIDEFRFIGNALVCITKEEVEVPYACFRIGGLRIGDPYQPQTEPQQEIPQANGITASVFIIVANESYQAYVVVGHKEGRITSLQLTGDYPDPEMAFSSIMLGDSASKVEELLGHRYKTQSVPGINGILRDYSPFPISIELVNDKVYSIRLSE